MSAGTKWIVAIVGLLAGNLIAMAVLLGAANTGGSRVLPQYYDRAIHYNNAIDQAAQNRALGWRVRAAWNGRAVVAEVTDRDGVALRDANIEIATEARVPGQQRGLYDVTVVVTRGADKFVERTIVEAR